MPDIGFIQSFLQQASVQARRSTALSPLGWALTIFSAALAGCISVKADKWIQVVLTVFLCILAVAYLVAYFYLLKKDPDALRSEQYKLSKLALERTITGDDIAGFIEGPAGTIKTLPSPPAHKMIEGGK